MTDIERRLREGVRGHPRVIDTAGAELAARRVRRRALEEGLADVCYTLIDSPLGTLLAARTARGVVRLAYEDGRREVLLEELSARVSPRVIEEAAPLGELRSQLDEYFTGTRRRFELELDWSLARGFGLRVLRATAAVPYGALTTYRSIAERAGNVAASRAAGNALGANPMPVIVPCHRVLHTGGGLGGYTGGLERKRFLLELESGLGG